MGKLIVAYVPVLHAGYRQLLLKHPDAALYVLGKDVLQDFNWLRKDLRALEPEQAAEAIRAWKLASSVEVVPKAQLGEVFDDSNDLILPDEDISHELAKRYPKAKISFEPLFLRWDRQNSITNKEVEADEVISEDEFDKKMALLASKEATKSSNIWRRVGAVIVKSGEIIGASSNRHQPTDHTAWIDGDVRMNFNRGVGIEMSTDMHAEALLIAEAAKRGDSLDGAELYLTTFPCPNCAMLVAKSGIKRCYYAEGYAVLDGQTVLKAYDVELIKVNVELARDRADVYRPYPEKS